MKLPVILFMLLFLVIPICAFSQEADDFFYTEESEETEDFESPAKIKNRQEYFISPLFEASLYGRAGTSLGGGLAFGYGTGSTLGMRLLYMLNYDEYYIMEMLFYLRIYTKSVNATNGFFLEINGGPVLFSDITPEISSFGTISYGAAAGWRFHFGKYIFAEISGRAGYPYLAGAGVSAGLRF